MGGSILTLSQGAVDGLYAGGLIGGWLALTYACIFRSKPQHGEAADTLVLHASQTGQATDIAERLHRSIVARGEKCASLPADAAKPEHIATAKRLFFVVSTTGDGLAPDNGHRFDQYITDEAPALAGKQVAILALGDRRYSQYCAFGHRIAQWAERGGAEFLFPPVEVDDLSASDLQQWQMHLEPLGYGDATHLPVEDGLPWQVLERHEVAGPAMQGCSGSDGLFRLQLKPETGPTPPWEIGDLFELHTPEGHRRDYSIASLPHEGHIMLYVRKVVHEGQVVLLKGVEIEASYAMANGLYLDLSANIVDGDRVRSSTTAAINGRRDTWTNLPANTYRLWLGKRFGRNLDLRWEATLAQDLNIDTIGTTGAVTTVTRKGYDVHTARASYTVPKGMLQGLIVRVSAENIFGAYYTPALATRPATGRDFKITLSKQF